MTKSGCRNGADRVWTDCDRRASARPAAALARGGAPPSGRRQYRVAYTRNIDNDPFDGSDRLARLGPVRSAMRRIGQAPERRQVNVSRVGRSGPPKAGLLWFVRAMRSAYGTPRHGADRTALTNQINPGQMGHYPRRLVLAIRRLNAIPVGNRRATRRRCLAASTPEPSRRPGGRWEINIPHESNARAAVPAPPMVIYQERA